MRTVFTNAECIKKWQEQSQESGRNRTNSLSFDGPMLYSYSKPIANIVRGGLVLITNDRFSSITTSWHTRLAYYPNHKGQRSMFVPSITPDHDINLEYFLDEMKKAVIKFSGSGWSGLRALTRNNRFYKELIDYCLEFQLKVPLTLGLYLDPEYEYVKKRIWQLPNGREMVVPIWVADKVKSAVGLEPKDMLRSRNAEVRKEIIKRVGMERILYSLKAKIIDKKGLTLFDGNVPENYELLLLDLGDGRRRPFLKMLNPSVPECWHVEAVHPACQTIQDALNYRRYGDIMVERHNGYYDREQLRWIFPPDTLRTDIVNWNPEILT